MDTLERGTYYKSPARFQRMEAAQREEAALKALFERKHFAEILGLMYREKTIRQKDAVEALGISKGIVCLNMNELDAVGFIQQRKEGRCKTYRLLKKGAEYYETHYLRDAVTETSRMPSRAWPEYVVIPEESKAELRRCLGEGAGTLQDALADILTRMDNAIEKLTVSEAEQIWTQRARDSMADAEGLASALRAVAERNDMLLYFYMGEYQAKLAWLREALRERRDEVSRGRHFDTILQLLYEEKQILKKDLAERLGISPGNTFLHVKAMIEAGFVEEGRDGVCRVYRISPDGERYYEETSLRPGRKAEPTMAKPEKRIRPKSAKKPVTVLNERNFTNIMQLLYEAGDIPLSDLCTRLERPHGNVYRDMQNLTMEGFVKEETVKHCNYYALSDKGKEYCEKCFR